MAQMKENPKTVGWKHRPQGAKSTYQLGNTRQTGKFQTREEDLAPRLKVTLMDFVKAKKRNKE